MQLKNNSKMLVALSKGDQIHISPLSFSSDGVWRSVFLASAIKLLLEAQLDNAHVPNGRMKPHHVCCLEMLHIEQKKMTFFVKRPRFSTLIVIGYESG